MQDEETQVPADDQTTADPGEGQAPEPAAPEGGVAAAQAADDSLLVQNLTLLAFGILAISHITGGQLFGFS